jgi:aminoglycoside phosphotransferase family enzyme
MSESKVARFRQEQILQEQAASQGLYGPAALARHESIIARMDRGAQRLLQMLQEGKHEEVAFLMETTSWALEDLNETTKPGE